ncbi:hypothetical protein, partial [Aureimonas ureilytica]
MEDQAGLLSKMSDIHCFEITEVLALTREMAAQMPAYGLGETSQFLPAPRTWVEYREGGKRYGMLLEDAENASFRATMAEGWGSVGPLLAFDRGWFHPRLYRASSFPGLLAAARSLAQMECSVEFIFAALALINAPRIVGRRQHMPHRGLEAKLVRRLG